MERKERAPTDAGRCVRYFMHRLVFLFALMLIVPSTIYAESSEQVRRLVEEPVTVLDLGLYKLENHINEFYSRVAVNPYNVSTEVQTGYIPNQNKILILIMVHIRGTIVDKATAKKICEDHYTRIRMILRLDKYFRKSSESYDPNDNLKKEIENITKIIISVANWDDPFNPLVRSRNMYNEKFKFIE